MKDGPKENMQFLSDMFKYYFHKFLVKSVMGMFAPEEMCHIFMKIIS